MNPSIPLLFLLGRTGASLHTLLGWVALWLLAPVPAVAGEVVVTRVAPHPVVDLPFAGTPEALANLRFDVLDHPDQSEENRVFGRALQLLVEGHTAEARATFATLSDHPDDGVRDVCRQIHAQLLVEEGAYRQLADTLGRWHGSQGAFVEALAQLPTPTAEPAEPIDNLLERGLRGMPMVHGRAGAHRFAWVFDTGAEFTVVNEGQVQALGVRVLPGSVSVGTSVEHEQEAKFGVVPEVQLGAVVFRDLPVLVVPGEAMQWKVDGTLQGFEGILGWNAIRLTRSELDLPSQTYRMQLSEPTSVAAKNLFWLDTPIVRLHGPEGQPLAFQLDTGSATTDMSASLPKKVPLGRVRTKRVSTGGLGSLERRRRRVADTLPIVISGYRFDVANAMEDTVDDATFVTLDGRLGSDVAQACRLTVDPANGLYELDCG